MKKIFIILITSTLCFSNASAVTLLDALNQTYQNNIQLNAERENIKASEEDVNIAKADYKPSLTLSGSKSIENTNKLTNQSGGDATINDVDPFSTSIKLEQKLLDYGRDLTLKKNITALDLAKAKLVKKEQEILHEAIYAFTNLIFARETLNINAKNLNLLIRQVENDKIRRDRGQITNTDLAQSESSLAGAQAQFAKSKSDLLISKLNYENVIGKLSDPNQLKKNSNAIVSIPSTLNEAINISKQNNPDILIAKLDLEKSEKDLAISESDLKPKATLSWPFYSGGKKKSTINKNSNLTTRKRLLLDDAVRTNETNVASAWSSLESSESFLNSVKVQVSAAKIANEGIAAEYERGSRTTLDVIQSNALLLSAQISLASSEKNYLMAQYNLLKAVGLLNSQYLKLK